MNCKKCGAKTEEGARFCPGCGTGIPIESVIQEPKALPQMSKAVFYSENWPRAKTMAIAVVPTYDLMADDDNFYVLKLPPSYAPVWGFFIGLVFLKLIGMLIGSAIGGAIAVAKRKSARNTWLDEDHGLTSSEYEKYIFLKIPLKELKQHLSFEKGKFMVIKYSEGKLTLHRAKKEYAVAEDYLKKYVL